MQEKILYRLELLFFKLRSYIHLKTTIEYPFLFNIRLVYRRYLLF